MNKAGKIIKWLSPNDEANEGRLKELYLSKLEEVSDGLKRMQTAEGGHDLGYYDETIGHVEDAIKSLQKLEG